jgi:hypothetical protein
MIVQDYTFMVYVYWNRYKPKCIGTSGCIITDILVNQNTSVVFNERCQGNNPKFPERRVRYQEEGAGTPEFSRLCSGIQYSLVNTVDFSVICIS